MIVPYFSQYESRALVEAYVSGKESAANDPLWQASGAETPEEYAEWAQNACGMACLKMIAACISGQIMPIVKLAKSCSKYGGYQKSPTGGIKGLYYKPFVDFVMKEFGITAEVCVNFPADQVLAAVHAGSFFIASVHPSIREPDTLPPAKGGHLVLVFRNKKSPERLMFHNPSGFTEKSQESVEMDIDSFDNFYALRGILVHQR